MFMNVLDTLLLLHSVGLLCHLISAETGFANKKYLAITFEVMVVLPLLCWVFFLTAKVLKLQKILKHLYGILCQKCKSCHIINRNDPGDVDYLSTYNPPLIQQVLIEPTAIENTYGFIDYTA